MPMINILLAKNYFESLVPGIPSWIFVVLLVGFMTLSNLQGHQNRRQLQQCDCGAAGGCHGRDYRDGNLRCGKRRGFRHAGEQPSILV
ncbi:Low-affinity putrescine importer PlaP [Pantoea agglomerans]|uniref:Low-affinity putrescine importer PlaP n=1 Tax=Enterobacter agglomerans TaxID=549 RepID=A0A379AEN3_ENTAG|nr:Low-affinity putrescine importer PlaP [Pantoea agglomerans]